MEDSQRTIGLADLLAEITNDLDDFRKKHPTDFGVKNITMWWEMEHERILHRYQSFTLVKTIRRLQRYKGFLLWFFAGAALMTGISVLTRLLIP